MLLIHACSCRRFTLTPHNCIAKSHLRRMVLAVALVLSPALLLPSISSAPLQRLPSPTMVAAAGSDPAARASTSFLEACAAALAVGCWTRNSVELILVSDSTAQTTAATVVHTALPLLSPTRRVVNFAARYAATSFCSLVPHWLPRESPPMLVADALSHGPKPGARALAQAFPGRTCRRVFPPEPFSRKVWTLARPSPPIYASPDPAS